MLIKYSPQRADTEATISAVGDVLTVTVGEEIDTFDFTDMPDGKTSEITSTLTHNPVIGAERIDGVLTVSVLYWYRADATEEEKQEREVTI